MTGQEQSLQVDDGSTQVSHSQRGAPLYSKADDEWDLTLPHRLRKRPQRLPFHSKADTTPTQAEDPILIHPASKPPSTCIIARIPAEIRNIIYELLLINPALGQAAYHTGNTYINKYELHPAILRTCRKFHTEASAILYRQKFFIAFLCTD
jgi:hypothetical protein